MGFELNIPWWFVLLVIGVAVVAFVLLAVVPVLAGVLALRAVLRERGASSPLARWETRAVVGWTCVVSLTTAVIVYGLGASIVLAWGVALLILGGILLPVRPGHGADAVS